MSCRPVSLDVPAGKLSQGIIHAAGSGQPPVEQVVRPFAALLRAEADHPFEGGEPHDVVYGLPLHRQALARQAACDLFAAHRPVRFQNLPDRAYRPGANVLGQPELLVTPPASPDHHGAEQRQHPARVLERDQVHGAAHGPGADHGAADCTGLLDATGCEPGRPHTDGQGLGDRVLRLYAAHVLYDLGDARLRPGVQALGAEAQMPCLLSGQVRDQPSSLAMAVRAVSRYASAPAVSHWGKPVLTSRAPFSM